jgi:hypothetical protein
MERSFLLTIVQSPIQNYVLNAEGTLSEEQKKLRKTWLGI